MTTPSGADLGSELMTLAQAAEYLGLAERTMYVWVWQDKIPAFKLGSTWRFRRADIDAWLEIQRAGPPVDPSRRPLTDPVEPPATKWRIRRQEEQASQAIIDACTAFIETTLRSEGRQVFVIDQFVDRFGQDVVDTVIERLQKEKKVDVTEERGLGGDNVRVLKRRR